MFGSEEGGVGLESQEEVSSSEDFGSVGGGFIEELLDEKEGGVLSDESFGSVSGRFIEELLGIKEGGMISDEDFCSSEGGFIEELLGVEEGGGGLIGVGSIEGGPIEELPGEEGCGGVGELVGFKGGSSTLLLEAELGWFCEVDSKDDVGFRGAS